jgi:hypothetical protein
MKRFMVCLLLLVGLAFFVAGCEDEETTDEHPKTEQATEQAAEQEAPKDHPAH